jgi:hypothetical protein
MTDDVWLGDRQRRQPDDRTGGAEREACDEERAHGQHR